MDLDLTAADGELASVGIDAVFFGIDLDLSTADGDCIIGINAVAAGDNL